MEYKFTKKDEDTILLQYKEKNEDKELVIKRDVELVKKLSNCNVKGRINLFKFLSENGMTKDDLVVKRKKDDGTIEYDERNYIELENQFIQQEQVNIISDAFKNASGKDIYEFIVEIADDNISQNELENFAKDLSLALTGKVENDVTPSQK